MAPRIILIRHAQAEHNVEKNYQLHDPPLTELGLQQCAALRQSLYERFAHLPWSNDEVAIIGSPMRRTLQTAQLSLDWLMERGVKITANADWQENSEKPCDTGSPLPEITAQFPSVDYSTVDPVYPDKTSPQGARYFHTKSAIMARGRAGLADLHARREKVIFVVSHSGFLRTGVVGWWFFNSDYRIFDFDGEDETGQLTVKQDESTLEGGLGLTWPNRVELGEGLPE